MCKALGVTESGYYKWQKSRDKSTKRQLLLDEIKKIYDEHPDNENYGVDRIQTALQQKGFKRSRSTVYRAMKEGGYLHKKRTSHGITKATPDEQKAQNLIKRDFRAAEPLTKLLSDVSEMQCANGKIYISPILDCHNGEIVALEIRDNMKKELCIDTVKQLKYRYGDLKNVILHTDRGCQYTSKEFRALLSEYGMIQSLSGTGKCYDNARMESFFATLKKEKLYKIPAYRMSKETVKSIIFRYIYAYYNTIRINSFNPGGLPPAKMKKAEEPAA